MPESEVTTDDPPDLSRLEIGDDLRVYYQSQRSGNEVDRKGEVTHTSDPDDGGTMYWVHVEQQTPLKHQFVVLGDAELESGDPAVAAYSATVSADQPNDGEPPTPGQWYSVQFTVARSGLLGVVDRIMRDGWNINVDQTGGI